MARGMVNRCMEGGVILLLFFLFCPGVSAENKFEIVDIKIHDYSPDWSVVMDFNGGSIQYYYKRFTNPERLIFDFIDTENKVSWMNRDVDNGCLYKIRISQFSTSVTRLVFEVKVGTNCKLKNQGQGAISFTFSCDGSSEDEQSTVSSTTPQFTGMDGTIGMASENEEQKIEDETSSTIDSEISETESESESESGLNYKLESGLESERVSGPSIRPEAAAIEKEDAATAFNSDTNYRLGPEDLLKISVFEMPNLNQTIRVNEDGTIIFPPLGAIQVTNSTASRVAETIATMLDAKYIKNPKVSVDIAEFRSQKISILGAVNRPGEYYLKGQRRLLPLLAQAGGITSNAGKEIIISRMDAHGNFKRIEIDIEEVMVDSRPELNIQLQPNDIVNIPYDELIYIYVYGAVNRPGTVKIKRSDRVTLLQVISEVGGTKETAALKKIRIQRKGEYEIREIIKVNLKAILKGKKDDILMQPDDIIIVPESFF